MTALKNQQIDAFVARPDPARAIVLVFGPDAGLVSERVEALVRASVDNPGDAFSVTRLSGDDIASDPARLADEAQAIPMFGGRRAIVVRAGARSFASAVGAVAALPLKECRVVIEAGDLARSSPLRAVCEKSPAIVALPCYADTERDIGRLVDEEMRAASLTLAPDARAVLTALLGGDRRASRNELRKLALYVHGRDKVTLDDVTAIVSDAGALAVDPVLDAAFAGNTADTDREFSRVTISGTNPNAVLGAALRHVAQLHKMRLALDDSGNLDDVWKASRIHFRREDAVKKALRQWAAPRLAAVLAQLADTVLAMRKAGAKLDDSLARSTLLTIARAARGARAA